MTQRIVLDGVEIEVPDDDIHAAPVSTPMPRALPDISDRQCFQQLAVLGKVSTDEALAAVSVGALPKVVTDGISALPAEQQFPARMLLCGATSFHRAHPMVPVFFGFVGITAAADIDAFWQAATLL